MKTIKLFVAVTAMAMIITGSAQAANLTWDANNTGALQTDGVGTWLNANQWWNGSTNVTWNNTTPDNATIGNGGAGNTITLGTVNAGTVTFGSFTGTYTLSGGILTQSGGISVATNSVSISSVLSGSGGITKAGTGTLTLSYNANQFTGPTIISNGKVKLSAQYALWKSPYDTTGSTGAIGLDVTGQVAPVLGGLAGNVDLMTGVTAYNAVTALTLNPETGTSVSYGGIIANGSGNMTLTKTGYGTQTLTNANTYTGATTIYAGTLALSGASGSALNSAFTVRGGTLSLDNSAGWTNRLADGTALSLGSLTLKSDNGGVAQTETVGATTLATSGKVTIDNGTGAGTTLAVSGAVTRTAGAAIDFVGLGGTLGSGAGNPNVTATTLPANANGILPWATVNGTLWAENNVNSIRAYSSTFVDPTSAGTDATKNAQLTGSGTIGSAKSFNSLNVIASGSGQSMSLGGILTLTSPGAILKSGADAYSITSSVANAVTAGTELITHVDGGDLTISAPLNGAIVGLAKGGTGKLVLSGTRAGTWSGPISIAGGQLEFQGATTFLNGTVSGPGGLTVNLNAGQKLRLNAYGANGNTYSGPTVVKGGILEIGSGYDMTGNFPGVLPSSGIASAGQGLLSNLELNGGSLAVRYYMSEFLGSGPGQFQITGGRSGIANFQGDAGSSIWTVNADANYEVVWGSTYFNPSTFVLGDATQGGQAWVRIPNKFDLNGATRTIAVDVPTTLLATGGYLPGVIRDSSGGSAGLIKTGVGFLLLEGANTFTGPVTVNQGGLTVSWIANGGVANPLGMSSAAASNLLLANGTTLKYTGGAANCDRSFTLNGTANGNSFTLDASGTGALVLNNTASPVYGTVDQTRTLILTGTAVATLTNTLVANLADNGTGALSVTKTGTCTWVLAGASTYSGTNTLSGGLLGMSATNNLGAPSTPIVFSGGGLQILGTGITSLSGIGHPITYTANNSVTLDIATAANIFTVDQTLGGANFVKSGAGTLVFSTNNTYTGQATISGGVLQYNDGMIIPTTPLLNNATLAVNRSDTLTQGVNFHSIMGGTGALNFTGSGSLTLNNINTYTGPTKASAGTITLSHPMALMNSAVDTAGAAGAIVLSGVTTPTFGGLTGTVAVATALTGYGGVTALSLNPQSGITYNYSGVIANGASGMALKIVGPGTQILQGVNSYSGATVLNAGTLELSGSGSILNSAITFSGGGLKLTNTAAETGSGRVHDTTGITANGGTLTYNNTSGANVYAEIVGSVALTSGQLDVVEAVNQASSGSQTLTLSGLTRTGASNSSAITFSSATALNTTKNRIVVTGASGAGVGQNLPGGLIMGPWASAGTTAAAQTDYAVFDASGYVLPANITASAETTWTTAANAYTLSGATTLTGTRTITALRYTGAAATFDLGANNLETYGLLNGGSGLLTVSGTGALTTPSGGGNLYVNAGANSITVNAPINNNGGNVTLVKNGGNTLTLSSTTSTYSGGTVINAGTLYTSADGNFGTGGGITVNGTATWYMGGGTSVTYNRTLTVNDGAVLTLSSGNASKTVTGVLSGSGSIIGANTTGYYFDNTGNTFTGSINNGYQMRFASVGDSLSPVNLTGSNSEFQWSGGSKTFALRVFTLNNTTASTGTSTAGQINNNGSGALTIQQPLAISGPAGARTLSLGGTYTGSTNTFAGSIADGPGSVISITKAGNGTWALSGTNTYTGTTTVSAGKLILSNAWAVASGIIDVKSGAKVQLDYTGSRPVTEFYTNGVKAVSGIIYNSVNAPNHILGTGSIMVGIETFRVTYNGNGNTGGAAPVDSNAYTNNQTVVVLDSGTLTKGVYSFGGWSMQAGPTYAPGSTFQITTNTTLYAIWRPAGTLIQLK